MIRQYPEALKFLYDNLPMFQRIGPSALKKDLTNTIRLCKLLGDPQKKFRSVHIAGTNGKGSSAHLIASIFAEAGLKTGLYTSPHLKEFTERIKINGLEVTQDFVVDFVNRIRPAIDSMKPSFFEITVAMAFDYFARQGVDIAIIETGLGGRLDSTNVIEPELALITNIGMDHREILGDTLTAIAAEKAGIIKPGKPCVIGELQPEVKHVFESRARELSSPLYFASSVFRVKRKADSILVLKDGRPYLEGVHFPLRGDYQCRNLPGVLQGIELLSSRFSIAIEHIRNGLERVIGNTGLKGRWQQLREKPLVICDTGHNVEGIREIVNQLRTTPHSRLHMVVGFVKDKDISGILSLLPEQASYYFCQATIPRALDAAVLREKALAFGLHGEVIPDVNEAKARAIKNASENDLIFIGGSTFVVAELQDI